MKRLPTTLLIAACLMTAACDKNIKPQEAEKYVLPPSICMLVSSEKANSIDSIAVFDNNFTPVKFTTKGNIVSQAIYQTDSWTGEEPVYAIKQASLSEGRCTAEGIFKVLLPEEQTISVPGDKASTAGNGCCSVGKIVEKNGNYLVDMKDVTATIRIAIENDDVAMVVAEAIGGEPMAGYIDVDLSKIDDEESGFWTRTPDKEQSSTVKIEASGEFSQDGCFKAGIYDIAVLPQRYASGVRVTLLDKEGNVVLTRQLGTKKGYSIARGETKPFNLDEDTLPDVIEIHLDFYNPMCINPLGFGTLAEIGTESAEGEEYFYTYKYTFEDEDMTTKFPFIVCKGKQSGSSYQYKVRTVAYGEPYNVLLIAKSDAWIKLPAIPNRYFQSITLSHGNTYSKQWQVKESPDAAKFIVQCTPQAATATELNTQTRSITKSSTTKTVAGQSYYLYFNNAASLQVFDVVLTYTRELPAAQ